MTAVWAANFFWPSSVPTVNLGLVTNPSASSSFPLRTFRLGLSAPTSVLTARSDFGNRLPMSSSTELPDASKLGSGRHPYGYARIFPANFSVSTLVGLPPISRAAATNQTTELPPLPLSTTPRVTTGNSVLHTSTRPHHYFAMATSSDIQKPCNSAVWNERQGLDIESHAGRMLQSAAGGLPHLKIRPRSALYRRVSQPSDFREVNIPRRMDTYLP